MKIFLSTKHRLIKFYLQYLKKNNLKLQFNNYTNKFLTDFIFLNCIIK